MAFDLIIAGGTVVDGSGLPSFKADVGIMNGKIAAIGNLKGQAAGERIDAEGHIVSPGFIDGHTHMDAQIFWDPLGTCSCWHGVTSVVMGNCGFTLAPCAEKDKRLVFTNLERAEDISPSAMEAGIPWTWETFPEFMETIGKLPKGINYGTYVGHSAIRAYVMGERSMTDKATPDDLAAMQKQVEISMRAGAIGFTTSRARGHRTAEGRPVASRIADWSEVEALVEVLGRLECGVFEIARDNSERSDEEKKAEREALKNLAIRTKVPMTFGASWFHRRHPDEWQSQVAMVDETNAAGGRMLMQMTSQWSGSVRSFETLMLFDRAPLWRDFRKLPLGEQAAGLRDPEMRRKLVEAAQAHVVTTDPTLPNALRRPIDWDWIFPMYEVFPPHRSIEELARERRQLPIETYIDLALEKDLKLFFQNPASNEDQDFVLALLRHPHSVPTFSDSGAHVNSVINASLQTYLLSYWVRQRQALRIEEAIRKITFDIASFWRLEGRGLLREGYCADVVVFDPNILAPLLPELVHDLPTGAERLLQKAVGIKATVVNGEVFMRNGEHTGALSGRLMKGPLARH
ncbi:MAG TPA: amidohydrolase family protein [Beijerinckiaceae bacterium]|nr:amidohydrolase family protein [Beijerinckiaceae bacterium]